jgi:REP element-mobilizing transposase RayT
MRTRKGRLGRRALDTKNTMHLVLRSTKAVGDWSFARSKNKSKIQEIIKKFSKKYGIKIYSVAYAGNHLHAQLKLSHRYTYKPFIRAITSAIAIAISGVSRWKHAVLGKGSKNGRGKFWDYRPYTRVVRGFRAFLTLRDYIKINQLEGWGYARHEARFLIAWENTERELKNSE